MRRATWGPRLLDTHAASELRRSLRRHSPPCRAFALRLLSLTLLCAERHTVVFSPRPPCVRGPPRYLILALLGRRYSSPGKQNLILSPHENRAGKGFFIQITPLCRGISPRRWNTTRCMRPRGACLSSCGTHGHRRCRCRHCTS